MHSQKGPRARARDLLTLLGCNTIRRAMANNFVPNSSFVYLYWSLGGELAVNVLGASKSAGTVINQAKAEELDSAIKTQFTNQISARIAANAQLVAVGVRDYSSANLPTFRGTGTAVAGTGTGDPLPRGAAIAVTLRTALSGRSFRGRTYLPGWDEAQNDTSGTQIALAGTAAVAFMTAISNAMATAGLPLAVVSRPADHVRLTRTVNPGTASETTEIVSETLARVGGVTPVTAIESRNNRWEYQRRRDNGRGSGAVALLIPVARQQL